MGSVVPVPLLFIYSIYISWGQKLTSPFQNLQNVNNLTKIRGIIKNACYFLFSTDLNKIFHRNNSWIMTPVQKFTSPWFLILCFYLMIHSCVFFVCLVNMCLCFNLFSDSCSWVTCLSWTVKLLQFFRKILQLPQIIWFCSIFVYLNPFQRRLRLHGHQ